MYSHQIEEVLRNTKTFVGTYPADKIPKLTPISRGKKLLIVNLDPSSRPGSHWVSLCVNKTRNKRILEYFDSYGENPFTSFPATWTLKYNPYSFQGKNSKVCGHYCVFFVSERAKNRSFKSILKRLKTCKNPDRFVELYLKRKARKSLSPGLSPADIGAQSCVRRGECYCRNRIPNFLISGLKS